MRNSWALAASLLTTACLLLAADEPAKPPRPLAPPVELNTKLRLVLRPTLLGLVPPDDPEDFGEVLVRVVGVEGEALKLRYEIKERVEKEVALLPLPVVGTATAEPERKPSLLPERSRPKAKAAADQTQAPVKRIAATRIRRGVISAARDAACRRIDAPLYWDDGDWQTDSGALWLSREAYLALKSGGSTPWDPGTAAWGDSPMATELSTAIAERRQARGLAADAGLTLSVESEARYPCMINGERADLPALLARDSLGLAKCWILDDANNPLVLKLTYLALEEQPAATSAAEDAAVGQAGAEAEAAAAGGGEPPADTAPAAGADPRRKPLNLPDRNRRHNPQEQVHDGNAPPPAGKPAPLEAAPDMISAGSGYAVVEINF